MAVDLQDILSRLRSKTVVLVERSNALEAENKRIGDENAELKQENTRLRKQLQQANSEIEYLKLVRSISLGSDSLVTGKAILTKLVQDIDKCISQLKE